MMLNRRGKTLPDSFDELTNEDSESKEMIEKYKKSALQCIRDLVKEGFLSKVSKKVINSSEI